MSVVSNWFVDFSLSQNRCPKSLSKTPMETQQSEHDSLPPMRSIGFRIRNQLTTYVVALVTTLCIVLTVLFTYNSSLETPLITSLIAKSPGRTILILNVLSQLTLFALWGLTTLTMDVTKWVLATGTKGTSGLTFLVLSKATSMIGALLLSFRNGKYGGKCERNVHRIWGVQRYVCT